MGGISTWKWGDIRILRMFPQIFQVMTCMPVLMDMMAIALHPLFYAMADILLHFPRHRYGHELLCNTHLAQWKSHDVTRFIPHYLFIVLHLYSKCLLKRIPRLAPDSLCNWLLLGSVRWKLIRSPNDALNAMAVVIALRGGLIFSLKIFPRLVRGYAHAPHMCLPLTTNMFRPHNPLYGYTGFEFIQGVIADAMEGETSWFQIRRPSEWSSQQGMTVPSSMLKFLSWYQCRQYSHNWRCRQKGRGILIDLDLCVNLNRD